MAKKPHIINTIRIVLLVIALSVVGFGVLMYTHTERANEVQTRMHHTDKIIQDTDQILMNLHAYIAAVRGFLIAQQPMHAQRIESTMREIRTHMASLRLLTADNPLYQQRLLHVEETYQALVEDVVNPLFKQLRNRNSTELIEEFQTASSISRGYLNEMTRLLEAIGNDERTEMDVMVDSTLQNLNLGLFVAVYGTLFIMILILGLQKLTVDRIRKADGAQKRAEVELLESNDKLSSVLEATRVGTWEWDISTGSLDMNDLWASLVGYTVEELQPISIDTWQDLVHPGDIDRVYKAFEPVFSRTITYYDIDYRMRHKDGHWVWIHDRGKVVIWDDQGNAKLMRGTHDDISQLKETEHYLSLEKKRLETTLLSVGDGVVTTDDFGCIVMINTVAEALTGWNKGDAAGRMFTDVFVTKDAKTGEMGDNPVARVLATGKKVEMLEDTILISRDGTERFVDDSAAPILDDERNIVGVILVFRDVTEKRREQQQIVRYSYTDQLTKVHNRRSYEKMLKLYEEQERYPIAFLISDVNGLKLTNDAFGHDLGDQLLMTVAEVLSRGSAEDDVVVRLGGDEFLVLMPDTDETKAQLRLQTIEELLGKEKIGPLPLSVSFGLAVKDIASLDSSMVFRRAESRMYRRKITESPQMKRKLIDVMLDWQHNQSVYDRSHSRQVELLSDQFARYLNLSEETIRVIRKTARYHDIGKVAVDKRLLSKTQTLDELEWQDLRRHAEIGYNLLRTIPELFEIAEGVLHHHERWDGTGYPRGIAGEAIPMSSRIISICDTFDAIVGSRPYVQARTRDEALQEIASCSGTQFDPSLVAVFLEMMAAPAAFSG